VSLLGRELPPDASREASARGQGADLHYRGADRQQSAKN
jgi:hypothetical protein